jgi:hypothetical protein
LGSLEINDRVVVEQRLELGHTLADFPQRIVGHPFLPALLRV